MKARSISSLSALILLAFVAFWASLTAQDWKMSEPMPSSKTRSASLGSNKGELSATWMPKAELGDELITYFDYVETGTRETRYIYNGVLNNSLVLRKRVRYYRQSVKAEPYYDQDEILYFPRAQTGEYQVRSSQFMRLMFKVTCDETGSAEVVASPLPR